MSGSFGESLREHRRLAGLSQRELADRIGLDFSYISKVENSKLPPPAADTVVSICHVLGIPPDELLAFTGKIPSAVQKRVTTNVRAQEFLREAERLSLTDEEWQLMVNSLYRLRSDR